MKLTAPQEAALTAFERDYQEYLTGRDELEATLRQEVDRQIAALRHTASMRANAAVRLGVPISQLGAKGRPGMNTTSRNTIYAFLEIAQDSPMPPIPAATTVKPGAPTPSTAAHTYSTDGNNQFAVLVNNTGAAREQYEAAKNQGIFNWSFDQIVNDPTLSSAAFQITTDGTFTLLPITDDWLADRFDRHPVVALHSYNGPALREAEEFLKGAASE